MSAGKLFALLAASLLLGQVSVARADEDADRLAAAPDVVKASAKSLMGDHKLEGFDKEVENGKTVYELDYSIGGSDYAAVIGENGAILEQEVEVDASVIPAAVTETAKKTQPDGKVKETAIVSAGGKLFYEFETNVGKDLHEIKINADGSLISDTVAAAEADAPDKGKEKEKESDKGDEKSSGEKKK